MTNLLSNAIKFTDSGEIFIEVNKTIENSYRFKVKDTGIGLTQNQISKLFQSFSQADETIARKYGGSGLGLAISKQLVELMGGKIWVASEKNIGSVFIFEINLEDSLKKEVYDLHDDLKYKSNNSANSSKPLIQISNKEVDRLFLKLRDALTTMEPIKCEPVIKEIYRYELSTKNREIMTKIEKLIDIFEFERAILVLKEKNG